MIQQEGVTEQMKADDPLLWAARIWTISGSILYYHGDSEGARIELEQYQRVMSDFFSKILPGKNAQ
ncbi:MAG: hypothetical protein IKM73_12335 [Acidaminococcaceae bacterium]|nr:hypothetical protein [Acidaminococcaceae bacterium]